MWLMQILMEYKCAHLMQVRLWGHNVEEVDGFVLDDRHNLYEAFAGKK